MKRKAKAKLHPALEAALKHRTGREAKAKPQLALDIVAFAAKYLDPAVRKLKADQSGLRRATFERGRRQKNERAIIAMADDVKTASYRRFAARVGRSKYDPNMCQAEGKR